jgi:anaerobic magnesium-protoporphyrin IX monomethyl ester cyclase
MEDHNPDIDILLFTAIDPFAYQIIPDLGLMYLAGALREAGHRVEIKDCRKERWDFDQAGAYVARVRPRVVGIKCYSNEANAVKRMTEVVRRSHPEAVIVAGGPHPSMDPAGTLRWMPAVDYAFIGEAERSLPPLVDWVKAGRPGPLPEGVTGVAYRDGGQIAVREGRLEEDLDRLPLPAWDLMPPDQYPDEAAGIFVREFPSAPMALSRGCPFRCAYCGCRLIAGGKMRYRSTASVLAEIDLLESRYGIKTFTFVDDNFTWDRRRALELFQALAARPRRISFTFPNGIRVDSFDAELLRAMEQAGGFLLALGIESGSDATLARMNKKQTRADVTAAVALVRRTTSMRVTGFFILGYPGETLADVRETIDFAAGLPIHHAHFCLFIPIPGTPVYQELLDSGRLAPEDHGYDDLTIDKVSLALPGLPPRRMLRLHQYAYLKFYARPWRIVELLRQVRSWDHFKVIGRRFLKLFR